jgi:hypothetical protein
MAKFGKARVLRYILEAGTCIHCGANNLSVVHGTLHAWLINWSYRFDIASHDFVVLG